MEKITITANGQTVDCYGEWRWDSNAACVFEDSDGDVFEEAYCDGADTWQEAVEAVTKYAVESGYIVVELVAI
jgi:hypothetical protein